MNPSAPTQDEQPSQATNLQQLISQTGHKTIQPLTTGVAPATQPVAPQPVAGASTPEAAVAADPSTDRASRVASVYPDMSGPAETAAIANAVPGPNLGGATGQSSVATSKVSDVVPILKVYAIVMIVLLVLPIIGLGLSLVSILRGGLFSTGFIIVGTVLAAVLLNLCIAIYLLSAKSFKNVTILLTVLLVLGALGIAFSLFSIVTAITRGYFSVQSLFSILVSVGYWFFLKSVRSQVSLAEVGRS